MALNPIDFLCDVTFSGAVNGLSYGLVSFSVNPSSPITIPAKATKALVRMWGGTGGSGGSSDGTGVTGGTGAAGYLEKFLSGLTPGNTLSFTRGSAGGGGTSTPTNGGSGTSSILSSGSQTISTLTANGSSGSALATFGVSSAGTSGGGASGGDFNLAGQAGTNGFYDTTDSVGLAGQGGSTMYSFGAKGIVGVGSGLAGTAGGLIIVWFS